MMIVPAFAALCMRMLVLCACYLGTPCFNLHVGCASALVNTTLSRNTNHPLVEHASCVSCGRTDSSTRPPNVRAVLCCAVCR
jgi:hypothetical protein